MESWWLNVLEKHRHTHCTGTPLLWYKATFSLFFGCFCSLKRFCCYCFDRQRERWKRRWSRDREEAVLVCRGTLASMQPACVFVKGSWRKRGRWCAWLKVLCRSRSLTPFSLSSTRLKEGGIRPTKCYSSGAHDLPFPLNAGCYPRVQALPTWTGSFVLSWLRVITTFWDRTEAKFSSLLLSFRSKYAAAFC